MLRQGVQPDNANVFLLPAKSNNSTEHCANYWNPAAPATYHDILYQGGRMTHDDIIRMAREADLGFAGSEVEPFGGGLCSVSTIERFAALVAAAEREAIAQMVENAPPLAAFANDNGGCVTCGFTPKLSARAIRARGQHD
jgi:hypothetical protein